MVAVRWSNGQVDRAADWDILLEKIRVDQFRDYPMDEFRAVLVQRAFRWSGEKIDMELPAEDLFMALSWARVVEIVHAKKKED